MVAGHVMIKIFTMFCTTLVAILPPLAFFPFLMNCVMLGFECLVALLQAYVFALLSCLYIKDTLYLH
jgi:F-type H+-transporting ATPase subunit a